MRRGSIFSIVLLLLTLGQGATFACLLACSPSIVTAPECHSRGPRTHATAVTAGDCRIVPNPSLVGEVLRRLSDDTRESAIVDVPDGKLVRAADACQIACPDGATPLESRLVAFILRI